MLLNAIYYKTIICHYGANLRCKTDSRCWVKEKQVMR